MELRLQQAIVATRAGRTDVAQALLTQLIRENPDQANAWFLLGHIVDAPERQTLYLRKTIELEPGHAIAKQRLLQLENGPVPAPIIPPSSAPDAQPVTADDSVEEALLETAPGTASEAELSAATVDVEEIQAGTQADTQLANDEQWPELAGRPVREKPYVPSPVIATSEAITPQDTAATETSDDTSSEVWLVRILVIMVILAAIVLGVLVLLILV